MAPGDSVQGRCDSDAVSAAHDPMKTLPCLVLLMATACSGLVPRGPTSRSDHVAAAHSATAVTAAEGVAASEFADAPQQAPQQALWPRSSPLDASTLQQVRRALGAHDLRRRVHVENLANVHTIAYKRGEVRSAVPVEALSGGDAGILRRLDQGTLEQTTRNLDIGIDGAGFLVLLLPDGTIGYTRAGQLHVDAEGRLVAANGCRLDPPLQFPQDLLDIAIDPEGRITGRTAARPDDTTQFGQMQLVRFVNESALVAADGRVLRRCDATGPPIQASPGQQGLGLVRQGFLERSNVEIHDELLQLQIVERNHRALVAGLRSLGLIVPE